MPQPSSREAFRSAGRPREGVVSPDRTLRAEFQASEILISQWIRAPRVTRIADGARLVDLWGTFWDADARVDHTSPGALWLDLRCYPGDTASLTIRVDGTNADAFGAASARGTFVFGDRLDRPEACAALRSRLEERHLDQMIALAHERACARVAKRERGSKKIISRLEALIDWRRGLAAIDEELTLAPLFVPRATPDDYDFAVLLERIDDAIDGDVESEGEVLPR